MIPCIRGLSLALVLSKLFLSLILFLSIIPSQADDFIRQATLREKLARRSFTFTVCHEGGPATTPGAPLHCRESNKTKGKKKRGPMIRGDDERLGLKRDCAADERVWRAGPKLKLRQDKNFLIGPCKKVARAPAGSENVTVITVISEPRS